MRVAHASGSPSSVPDRELSQISKIQTLNLILLIYCFLWNSLVL